MASDEKAVPGGALAALEALKWPKCERCHEFMPVGECRVIFSASVTHDGKFKVELKAAHDVAEQVDDYGKSYLECIVAP